MVQTRRLYAFGEFEMIVAANPEILKSLGVSTDIIVQSTGLSPEEIADIK